MDHMLTKPTSQLWGPIRVERDGSRREALVPLCDAGARRGGRGAPRPAPVVPPGVAQHCAGVFAIGALMGLSAEQLQALRQMELALRVDDPGLTCKFTAWDRILAGRGHEFRLNAVAHRGESRIDAIVAKCCIAFMIGLVLFVLAITVV
jgi:hypothetical protein